MHSFHHPALAVVSGVSLATLFFSRYGVILADAVLPNTNWVDAAERLGVLATVVLFSFITGAGLLKWLMNRSANREDQTAKADTEREERLGSRVVELEDRLIHLAEDGVITAQRSADALEASNRAATAMLEIASRFEKEVVDFVEVRRKSACYAMTPDVLAMALRIHQLNDASPTGDEPGKA